MFLDGADGTTIPTSNLSGIAKKVMKKLWIREEEMKQNHGLGKEQGRVWQTCLLKP